MSTKPSRKRILAQTVVAIVVGVVLAGAVPACSSDGNRQAGPPQRAPNPELDRRVPQAKWDIIFKDEGLRERLSRGERKLVTSQRAPLRAFVTDLYDAMFLAPDGLQRMVRRDFSAPAAQTLSKARVGLPSNARNVRIMRRVARIGIDREGAARAATRVRIVVRGAAGNGHFATEHLATLYLTRVKRDWTVIGFNVDQTPFRPAPKKRSDKSKDAGRADRPAKGNRDGDARGAKRRERSKQGRNSNRRERSGGSK